MAQAEKKQPFARKIKKVLDKRARVAYNNPADGQLAQLV